MKKLTIALSVLAMIAITLSGCKVEPKKTSADDLTNSKDANGVSNAVDATSDDATSVAGQVAALAGKTSAGGAYYWLCGGTVVDTSTTGKVVLTYDGTTNCNGVTRSGTITVSLASGSANWYVQGAVLNVQITNVKVTDVTTGNSFTLNGTHTITNETGGLAWELWWNPSPGMTVSHRDKSNNMTVNFSDGTSGSWSVDRTRTWSINTAKTVRTFSVSSENVVGGTNQDSWGTNRYGEQFTTNIATPISANDGNLLCWWRPFEGKYVYNVPSRSATASITFGTNSAGASVGTATSCAPGYYVTYKLANYNYNYYLFLPYW